MLACGSTQPPAATTPDVPPSASGASAPAAPTTPSLDDPYVDVETDPTTLTPLFSKGALPAFPPMTASPATCWQTVSLTGDAQKDYATLEGKCGAPTGAAAYVKPAAGKLHSIKDKRDTYRLHLQGGLCYRYFGVADGSIQDLDILILSADGALVGDDKTKGPVAIIEMNKTWCQDRDVDYQFAIEVHGSGTGRYVFGVWATPK